MTDHHLIDPRLHAEDNAFVFRNSYYGPDPSEQQAVSMQHGDLLRKDDNLLDYNFQYEAMSPPEFETSAPNSPGISISNPEDQAQHPCLKPGCNKIFTHLHKLQRHYRDAHGKPQYDCPYPGCSRKGQKGFARKDNMTQHHKLVHNKQLDPGAIPRKKRGSSS